MPDELFENLKITLQEALEFYKLDAIAAAGADFQEEAIAIGSGESRFAIYVLTVAGKVGATLGGITRN